MRYFSALLASILINLALWWGMQYLLQNTHPPLKRVEHLHQVEFVRLETMPHVTASPSISLPAVPQPPLSSPPPKITMPPLPPPVAMPEFEIPMPALPALNLPHITDSPYLGAVTPPTASPMPVIEPPQIVMAERDIQPITRVKPEYPRIAKRMGKQGEVILELIIDLDGSVETAEVISAKPAGFFEESALRAVQRWQFMPKIINGQAVKQRAQQSLIFKLF